MGFAERYDASELEVTCRTLRCAAVVPGGSRELAGPLLSTAFPGGSRELAGPLLSTAFPGGSRELAGPLLSTAAPRCALDFPLK